MINSSWDYVYFVVVVSVRVFSYTL